MSSCSFIAMRLRAFTGGSFATNAYLLADPSRGEAVLIDAPEGIWAQVGPALEGERCRLTELWITHAHIDHTLGGAELVGATGARVRAHRDGRPLLEDPERMRGFVGPGPALEPLRVDAWVEAGDRLEALGTSAEVRPVPGHCPGSVLFYFADPGSAFVGDALFRGSVGRTDVPGGDFGLLERSIRTQIYTLPDSTRVYPGHGPETTVGAERETNPYVRGSRA
jgi:hydroxyacylglutathione hydrolase